jgi:hypothetical protein
MGAAQGAVDFDRRPLSDVAKGIDAADAFVGSHRESTLSGSLAAQSNMVFSATLQPNRRRSARGKWDGW